MPDVLTIDDGGTHAVGSVAALHVIQERIKRPIHDVFDHLAGSGTGAIIAAALGLGMAPSDLEAWFKSKTALVWSRWRAAVNRWFLVPGIAYLQNPREPLRSALDELFGSARMRDAQAGLILVSYDLEEAAWFFMTSDTPDLLLREAVEASMVCPCHCRPRLVTLGSRTRFVFNSCVSPAGLVYSYLSAAPNFLDSRVLSIGSGKPASGRIITGGKLAWRAHIGPLLERGRAISGSMVVPLDPTRGAFERLQFGVPYDRRFRDDPRRTTLQVVASSATKAAREWPLPTWLAPV